jgi:L-ascorbate metabolism protein UlaG (beta-lactamase superfamily)
MRIAATYVGGPPALLEIDGVSVITDPTFDPAPHEYWPGPYTLSTLACPSIRPESIDCGDAALLSHDHHLDDLD